MLANTAVATPDPAAPDSGWQPATTGVEWRNLRITLPDHSDSIPLALVRLDPATIRLRIAYTPTQPQALRTWFMSQQPLLAINAGYFDQAYQSSALVMSDGVAIGESYSGFGGMLASDTNGVIQLRSLRDAPYDPAEPLQQAIQSAPMLVFAGGVAAAIGDDGERARRSAVAFDRAGRLIFLVAPTSAFSLQELANWLATSDLDIDRALNLDGGSSSGMFLAAANTGIAIDSFSLLPTVILIESR
jgi:uncharacterized protein YigE (DUF2233 family)